MIARVDLRRFQHPVLGVEAFGDLKTRVAANHRLPYASQPVSGAISGAISGAGRVGQTPGGVTKAFGRDQAAARSPGTSGRSARHSRPTACAQRETAIGYKGRTLGSCRRGCGRPCCQINRIGVSVEEGALLAASAWAQRRQTRPPEIYVEGRLIMYIVAVLICAAAAGIIENNARFPVFSLQMTDRSRLPTRLDDGNAWTRKRVNDVSNPGRARWRLHCRR